MCFSATASFVSAGLIAVVGTATLAHVREPRTALFAAVPLLFAVHQFAEGVVWLGMDGVLGPVALARAAFVFRTYAQGILPFLFPLGIALIEPPGGRRRLILGLCAIGLIVCVWDVFGLAFYPNRVFVDHHSIAYRNKLTGNLFISLLYILATCGALLVSSHRVLRWYGVLNIIALSIVEIVKAETFASVWCFYAALMSVVIFWHFRRMDGPPANGGFPDRAGRAQFARQRSGE